MVCGNGGSLDVPAVTALLLLGSGGAELALRGCVCNCGSNRVDSTGVASGRRWFSIRKA